MIDEMTLRGFSPRTHEAYLTAVFGLAKYYRRSPDQISIDEVQAYLLHCLNEQGLSAATCRQIIGGLKFFFVKTLRLPPAAFELPRPRAAQRLPDILSSSEVLRLLAACANLKHRTLLETTYAAGLRVSEVTRLRVEHIDVERGLLRVEQGKGQKDRYSLLSTSLAEHVRDYRTVYAPTTWLFPSSIDPRCPLEISSVQKAYTRAKRAAGLNKSGGIHALRHAFATHQLEAGMPVHRLQQVLGHRSISTTMRYIHLVAVPGYLQEHGADLLRPPA